MLQPPPLHVDVNQKGELVFVCPLCEDSSGHLQINVSRGLYFCLRCGKGGSVLALRKLTGIAWPYDPTAWAYRSEDKTTAASLLDKIFGKGKLLSAEKKKVEKVDYNSLAANGDQFYLPGKVTEPAGLGRPNFVLYFNVLPAAWWTSTCQPEGSWAPVIQAARYLVSRGYSREELLPWHLFMSVDPEVKGRQNRIVFPAWHPETKLLTDYRARTMRPDLKPKYLGPKLGAKYGGLIYGPLAREQAALFKLDTVVLCEGPLDVVAIERTGFPAVAVCGKTTQDRQVRELKYYGVKEAIILLDKGEQNASLSLAATVSRHGIQPRIASLYYADDPGKAGLVELQQIIRIARTLCIEDYVFKAFK